MDEFILRGKNFRVLARSGSAAEPAVSLPLDSFRKRKKLPVPSDRLFSHSEVSHRAQQLGKRPNLPWREHHQRPTGS
ncbi:hypothetical protein LDENG_00293640 [Lucifuga dentata]|nr:hypothetical protein LDENG_00293640 [Lucifuga dentata]